MVGREIDVAPPLEQARQLADVRMLEVDGLTVSGDRGETAVNDVSFAIREGEIVGVAGVAGNGQRELAEALSGMRDIRAGKRSGRRPHACDGGDPREAILAGVAHVPEDRLGTGLAPSLSVTSNVVIKTYRSRSLSRGPLLALRRMRDAAVGIIGRYDVKTPGPGTPVRNLSGGNLQKLVLGREFADDPLVLVVAQPTRGLDVGAIETVHAYLRDAAAKGVAILLMSEDLDEIRALADRILVIYEGEIVGELPAGSASVEEIGLLMAGATRRVKLERRLTQPWWLSVAVPVGSLVVAFVVMGVVLALTGHSVAGTYRKILEAGFTGNGAMSATLISATPILFTGLAAAAAFRMQLFNIGAEGQLYLGRDRRVVDRAPTRRPRCHVDADLRRGDVRGSGGARRALGIDPRCPSSLRADERDHHLADAQLRRGTAPHVSDLRQLVLLARHVDVFRQGRFRRASRCPTLRTGRPSGRRSSSRSGSSSGSQLRSACGSSTRACGSGSR